MIRHGVRYVSFAASASALLWLAHAGIIPTPHPFQPGQYLLETGGHAPRTLRIFFRRPDVIVGLLYVFVTGGATVTLPSDFNTASNQINAIGASVAGSSGANSGGDTGGAGGAAGGGGAFAKIFNYSGHTAGQVVNIQVGTGDTWFDSTAVLLAKAASGQTGGQAASCVGTVTFSGGNGGSGGAAGGGGFGGGGSGGGGGGGGGAAGPDGAGNNGANGSSPAGGIGATGDAGNTAANANGTQFDPTHGSGGGGTGGAGGTTTNGTAGNAGGLYGAGGGGGGGGGPAKLGAAGGALAQGLIVIGYTPAGGGSRSFGFILT